MDKTGSRQYVLSWDFSLKLVIVMEGLNSLLGEITIKSPPKEGVAVVSITVVRSEANDTGYIETFCLTALERTAKRRWSKQRTSSVQL